MVSFIAETTSSWFSVLRLLKSPISLSSSLIALTIELLSAVVKLLISEFFFPVTSVVYSAPNVAKLLSACKSTSFIASTTEFLESVVNWGIELSLDLLEDKLPISACNSLIASTIVTSSFSTAAKRSLFFVILFKSGLL